MYHLAKTKARKPRKKRDTRRKSRNARKTRHTRKPHKTQQKRKPRKSRNSRRRKRRHRGGATDAELSKFDPLAGKEEVPTENLLDIDETGDGSGEDEGEAKGVGAATKKGLAAFGKGLGKVGKGAMKGLKKARQEAEAVLGRRPSADGEGNGPLDDPSVQAASTDFSTMITPTGDSNYKCDCECNPNN